MHVRNEIPWGNLKIVIREEVKLGGARGRNGGEMKEKGGLRGGQKKRPSVETEGRLTIACHMKNLQKIGIVELGPFLSSFFCSPSLFAFNAQVRKKFQRYSVKKELNNNKWLKKLCELLKPFFNLAPPASFSFFNRF